jgi:hypothetical protein
MDAPGVIYSAVPGHFGRDALDLGYLLGFVGGGDSHDGHPGLTFLASNQGGLTAVLDAELDRDSLWGALRARRTYATNGCRTLLFTTLDGHPMGSTVTPSAQGRLVLFTIGDAPLQQVDIVRTGAIMERIAAVDQPMVQATVEIEALESGEYLYVRVLQQNGGVAISSPFFVRAKPATRPAPPERND